MTHRLFGYGKLAPGRRNEHVLADVPGEWESATVHGYRSTCRMLLFSCCSTRTVRYYRRGLAFVWNAFRTDSDTKSALFCANCANASLRGRAVTRFTGGEGPITGQEVRFNVNFTT